MLSWLRNTVEIARQTSLLLLRTRMFLGVAVVALLLAGVFGWVASQRAPRMAGDDFFGFVAYMVFFQFGLPFLVLYFGVTAIHGDIADRSVTYLFVRPVHRLSLPVGKWLAVVVCSAALVVVAMTALYTALALPDWSWRMGLAPTAGTLGWLLVAGAMAVAAYGALGICFGAVFRRPLIQGVAFVIGWEMLASNAPPQAGIRGLTVADPIRRWLLETLQPQGSHLRGILQRDLDEVWLQEQQLGDPVRAVANFTVVMLVAAAVVYARREYDSRPRE